MVFHSVKDGDQNADCTLGVMDVGGRGRRRLGGEEGAGQIADRGYNDGKIIATVPEAVVGGLIAKHLSSELVERRSLRGRSGVTYKHKADDNREGWNL